MSCKHCHVEAGPERKEIMSRQILSQCLEVIQNHQEISIIDITGGAPEMNPELEWFLNELHALGSCIIVRTNLVILEEPEYAKFIDIYTKNKVELMASLPSYKLEQMENQRDKDTFNKAIAALKKLNKKGYAKANTGLIINLMHNSGGAYLPGSQQH